MGSVRRSLSSVALTLVVLAVQGCTPSCDRVCEKVRDCGVVPRLAQLECDESCERQLAEVKGLDDNATQEAFAAHRRCIMQATCDEIEEGVCYDETLYPF